MPETINPIYSGRPKDFHWFGMGSGSGTNLVACTKVKRPSLIICDRPKAKLLSLEELAGIPRITLDGYSYCGSWEKAKGDPEAEAEYQRRSTEFNKEILKRIREFETRAGITLNLGVLGGYMKLITDPLLTAFKDRIINIHPASVPVMDGKRMYIGDDAVYDALQDRQQSTRSSVLFVDEQVDHGEILVQGPELAVWHEFLQGTNEEKEEALREYADAHQSMQKVRSDWPALTTALKMISEGRIAIGTEKVHHGEWRQVYVDGNPFSYEGFQLAS